MARAKRVAYNDEDRALNNAESTYGEDSYAAAIINHFGTSLSEHTQDALLKDHGSSLEQARSEGFRTKNPSGHAHPYELLDHLGY